MGFDVLSELTTIAGALREQQHAAHLSPEERSRRRLDKFRRLARYANIFALLSATSSPSAASTSTTFARPEDFPGLDKTLLMANFDRIVTDRRVTKQGITDFLARSKDPVGALPGQVHR